MPGRARATLGPQNGRNGRPPPCSPATTACSPPTRAACPGRRNSKRCSSSGSSGEAFDQAAFEQAVADGIDWVVAKQLESGVDIGCDGEESRVGFQTYVPQRMSGFGGESQRNMLTDMVKFPGYAAMFTERTWSRDKERPKVWNAPQAQTAVQYEPDLADVSFELAISSRRRWSARRAPSPRRS